MTYAIKILAGMAMEIVYFPIWWYSRGLLGLVGNLKDFLKNKERSIGFLVWVRNIFRPMYGQADIWGSLISFVMRSFQIVVRGIAMLFWLSITSLAVCFWLLMPFFLVYQIILQLL